MNDDMINFYWLSGLFRFHKESFDDFTPHKHDIALWRLNLQAPPNNIQVRTHRGIYIYMECLEGLRAEYDSIGYIRIHDEDSDLTGAFDWFVYHQFIEVLKEEYTNNLIKGGMFVTYKVRLNESLFNYVELYRL